MEEKLRILLCEDDESLGMLLREYLQAKGYEAELFPDGDAGYKAFLKNRYEMCVLDVMMPKKDGFQLAQEIRQVNAEIPIIFLTAKNLKEEFFDAFNIGADDYITKPFSMRELMARVKANIRRTAMVSGAAAESGMSAGGALTSNTDSFQVFTNGKPIELTQREYELLTFLASRPDKVFSRVDLKEQVWNYGYVGDDVRTVDVTVRRLREKIEDDPASPRDILTRRGEGYYYSTL